MGKILKEYKYSVGKPPEEIMERVLIEVVIRKGMEYAKERWGFFDETNVFLRINNMKTNFKQWEKEKDIRKSLGITQVIL